MSPTRPAPLRQLDLPNGLPLTQFALPNGLQLYVVENHAAPVFTYETWFKVGSKDEKLDPQLKATGLAHLFEHMMFRGTKNFPDGQFDEVLARSGVDDENATTWLDRTNYYQSLPNNKLELVVELESDRMINLALDSKLLETEKGAVLGEYRMGLDDPDMVSYDKLYETAYQVHPYRYTTIGTEEEIKSFTVDMANYFYRKYYAPNNATIIVVGDVDPAQVYELVKKYYGSIASHPIEFQEAPAEPEQKEGRSSEFHHPQLSQVRVLFGYSTVPVSHLDFAPLWLILSAMTYGQGAILEEEWVNSGVAISCYGDLNQFRDPGLFILMADLQSDHESEEGIQKLETILNQVVTKLGTLEFAQEVIERARNQLLLSIYQQCEDNASLASLMGEFISSVGDPTFAFELLSRVERTSMDDLMRVAKKYFQPHRRTRVVGYPQENPKEASEEVSKESEATS
jgi:zinc protease